MACALSSDPSPSAARRKALRDADSANIMKVIESYPIEKYYAVTDRLLQQFLEALDERRLDDAYVYGIRFATFSIESLPKHKNYKHRLQASLRIKNARQVDQVLKKLESVTARMDAEELVARQHRERQVEEHHQHLQQREIVATKTCGHEGKESRNDVAQRAKDKLRALQIKSDHELATKQKRVLGVFRTKKQKDTATVAKVASNTKQGSMAAAAKVPDNEPDLIALERMRLREEAERLVLQQKEEEAQMLAQERKRIGEETERRARKQRENDAAVALVRERKRQSDEAELLARQQREQAASEEMKVMKLVAKEAAAAIEEEKLEKARDEKELEQLAIDAAAEQMTSQRRNEEDFKRQAALTALNSNSSRLTLASAHDSSVSSRRMDSSFRARPTIAILPEKQESPYKPSPMTEEEERTLALLRATIAKHESRLAALDERKQIKALLLEAKSLLTSGDRKGAIRCMARKKSLERSVDALKGAIFTMETHIILLESAVENRHVSMAMQAATEAMQSLHVDMSDVSMDEMNHAVVDFASDVANDALFDEDELLSELQGPSDIDVVDQHSLLSLPAVPKTHVQVPQYLPDQPAPAERIMASWF